MRFCIYNDSEEISKESIQKIEQAMESFIESDVPLAVEFTFVDEGEIQRLNRTLRQTDKVTDVLSFPTLDGIKGKKLLQKDYPFDIDETGNLMIGSIAVCIKRAKQQAEEYGHSFERELHYLLIHGILHCLGFDHIQENDKTEMRAQEEKILNVLGITRE